MAGWLNCSKDYCRRGRRKKKGWRKRQGFIGVLHLAEPYSVRLLRSLGSIRLSGHTDMHMYRHMPAICTLRTTYRLPFVLLYSVCWRRDIRQTTMPQAAALGLALKSA